jgi:transposase InsO family protein
MGKNDENEIMLNRYVMISPLINCDKALFSETVRSIAKENELSEKTIRRYVAKYNANKLEGLKPLKGGRPGNRSITPEILQEAITLRRQNPTRSVQKIIRCLEMEGFIEEGTVKRSTLQDQLAKNNFSKSKIIEYTSPNMNGGPRFQRKERNSLWQSDVKYGPIVGGKKTYLVTFIDDCTRFLIHSEFYHTESADSIVDCFRKGIIKFGTPKSVYFDNGKPYKAKIITRSCGHLGITKYHHKVYSSKSKGKVEKFHQVVDQFISEIRLGKAYDLQSLNQKWHCYSEQYYQNFNHHGLKNKETPKHAYDKSDIMLAFVSQEKLANAFLHVEIGRKVDKSGCVNFQGKKYTAEGMLQYIGRKVDVIWDNSDILKVWIEVDTSTRLEAKPLEIKEWVSKSSIKPQLSMIQKTSSSRFIDSAQNKLEKENEERENGIKGTNKKNNFEKNDCNIFHDIKSNDLLQESIDEGNEDKNEIVTNLNNENYKEEKVKGLAINFRHMKRPKSEVLTSDESIKSAITNKTLSFNSLKKDKDK